MRGPVNLEIEALDLLEGNETCGGPCIQDQIHSFAKVCNRKDRTFVNIYPTYSDNRLVIGCEDHVSIDLCLFDRFLVVVSISVVIEWVVICGVQVVIVHTC